MHGNVSAQKAHSVVSLWWKPDKSLRRPDEPYRGHTQVVGSEIPALDKNARKDPKDYLKHPMV